MTPHRRFLKSFDMLASGSRFEQDRQERDTVAVTVWAGRIGGRLDHQQNDVLQFALAV